MARKHNKYSDREITDIRCIFSRSKITADGNLKIDIKVSGESYPNLNHERYQRAKLWDNLFSVRDECREVSINPFIPNYAGSVQAFYNLLYIYKLA